MTVLVRLTISLLLVFASTVHAQSTRAEEIAGQQARKAANLAPDGPTRAETIISRFAVPGDPDGFYPLFASPFPSSGFSMGVGYQRHLPHGVRAGGGMAWSVQNFKLVEGRVGLPLRRDHRLRVDARGRWIDAPSVAFYGFGPDSTRDDRVEFGYRPSSASATLTAYPAAFLRLTAGYTLQNAATTDEGDTLGSFPPPETPGFGQDLVYHVVQGGVAIDTRPSPLYSDHGSFLRVDWSRYRAREDQPFSFDLKEVEIAQLVPLVGRHLVLAFRALGTTSDPIDGGTVPFMLAPYVGSGGTLRGFRNRRFQDRHRLLLNGEYRWQASRYLNMAIFYDAGQVQPERDRFKWREFETAWGVGARFHTATANVLRLEVARSREGWRLVASTNQPF